MAEPTDDDVSTDDGPDVEATDDAPAGADDTGTKAKKVAAPTKTKPSKRRPDPQADVAARRAATAARMDAEKSGGSGGSAGPGKDAKPSLAKATADDPTGTKARRAGRRAAGTGATGTATADDPTGAKARREEAARSKKVARPSKRTGGAADGAAADRKAARSGNPRKAATAAESGRYTQPIPRSQLESPVWVPAIMFTLLGLGGLVILLTYVIWNGRPLTLGIGLALILGGILTATQYR